MTKLVSEVENIKKMINHAQNIEVVGHHNPDGDCIGCCVAMSLWLESKGKTVSIFADGVPGRTEKGKTCNKIISV